MKKLWPIAANTFPKRVETLRHQVKAFTEIEYISVLDVVLKFNPWVLDSYLSNINKLITERSSGQSLMFWGRGRRGDSVQARKARKTRESREVWGCEEDVLVLLLGQRFLDDRAGSHKRQRGNRKVDHCWTKAHPLESGNPKRTRTRNATDYWLLIYS